MKANTQRLTKCDTGRIYNIHLSSSKLKSNNASKRSFTQLAKVETNLKTSSQLSIKKYKLFAMFYST